MTEPTVRVANVAGRAGLLVDDGVVDVERESDGQFPSDPMALLRCWDQLVDWARSASLGAPQTYVPSELGPCVPAPSQVFAVGLNYRAHAAESQLEAPLYPMIFTKFPSCLTGPFADVVLPSAYVDWEVELVVVIGRTAVDVSPGDAPGHVAGYCVGQDISERRVQNSGQRAQFSLGKSFPGFGPIGPATVVLDDAADPNDLELTCTVGGKERQRARTTDMIFPVATLVSYLSSICALAPGDLIFTGTPDGVGGSANPPVFLQPGDEIVSAIEGLGQMANRCQSRPNRPRR